MPGALRRNKNKPRYASGKHTSKTTFRSRVTAGLTILPTVDGRSTWARVMRDTMLNMIAHAGGADQITEPRRLLARRVAALESELIHMEDVFARTRAEGGSPCAKALDLYQRMCGSQRRCLEALGLDPHLRDVTPPDPLSYAAQYDRHKVEDAEEAEEMEA